MNDIITNLECSGYGCQVAGKYVGVIMYADDHILISASCTDLRQMIKICELEISRLDMHFNAKNSCLVRCGPRYSKNFAGVLLNGAPLRLCNGLNILALHLTSNAS